MNAPPSEQIRRALVDLLATLAARGYDFVTPGQSAIRRMRDKPRDALDLRDIFGWSLPFRREDIPDEIFEAMERAGVLRPDGEGWRSAVRVSRVEGLLFLHSAFPTNHPDSVFLGPDSYRFAAMLRTELGHETGAVRIADIGSGAGVGGLVAASLRPGSRVVLTDINPRALVYAAANARHAGQAVALCEGPGLSAADGQFDLIVANPPFIAGKPGQAYKDGGDLHGARISLDWAVESMARLTPGGRLMMYTGSPVRIGGEDIFKSHLAPAAAAAGCQLAYRELDPDIFASELRAAAYDEIERMAAVSAVVTRLA